MRPAACHHRPLPNVSRHYDLRRKTLGEIGNPAWFLERARSHYHTRRTLGNQLLHARSVSYATAHLHQHVRSAQNLAQRLRVVSTTRCCIEVNHVQPRKASLCPVTCYLNRIVES